MYMYEHFKNIEQLYGDAYVQIPNGVFQQLSESIKNRKQTNIQQSSFAYAYIIAVSFLYKYAHFVDIDNGTYIQNSDIKQILGYDKTTKTIDKVIKKNGILDSIGLLRTTKEYPIEVEYTEETLNDMLMREFKTFNMLDADDINYSIIKSIVKNRNYEVKEPLFFFEYDGDTGTLYNYNNTHRITLKEFLSFVYDQNLDNIDFMLYCFFKYKCHGYDNNVRAIALYKITLEMGISRDTFYKRLQTLKDRGYVNVHHKGWVMPTEATGTSESMEANEYQFRGVG
ncbi:replication initiator [Bacillus phage Kirov]|uniref:Replication initiator n=1 Tax=Bacillus phage Kirov TaxID=2783539 RepID=A0A7S6TYP5_9CAUD|nr:transcriptional regulator [Bacillus phage Kirov]QOV08222.1 replication initiator [Bacillus phage Kirov]